MATPGRSPPSATTAQSPSPPPRRSRVRRDIHCRLPSGYVAERVGPRLCDHHPTRPIQNRGHHQHHRHARLSREHLYVALTRGRADNHAYTPLDTGSGVDIEEPHLQADGASLNETGCDVLEQILATSSAEPSATESLESPRYPQTAPRPRLRPQNQPNTLPLPTSPGPDGPGLTR